MSRILAANLFRLRKSRMFRAAVLLTLLITAAGVLFGTADGTLEGVALSGAPLVQMAGAAAAVLFIGTDNSEKTVRNKLCVGSRRREVYAANVLTSIVISCSVNAAWLLGGLAGVPFFGWWKMPPASAAVYVTVSMLCAAALGAMAALLAMLIRSRSAAVAAICAALLALLTAAAVPYKRLSVGRELMVGQNVDGETVFELVENPDYVDGAKRAVLTLALNVNPMGVSAVLSNCDLGDPAASMAGTAFTAIFVCSLGAAVFGRKDLQ